MGTFYNSICIPGERPGTVRRTLERWLYLKGFEPLHGPILFDLDGDNERSAFLVWNDRWTLLLYSHFDEERRLIRDLQAQLEPLLYIWVHDSEVWGYDLFDHRGFLGSFVSNARSQLSFPEEPLGEERPRMDARLLCRELGMPQLESHLRRIETRRSAFKDDVCWDFCRGLGVEAAAASYDQLESGRTDHLDGWKVEQFLFVRRDLQTVSAAINLSEHHLMRRQTLAGFVPDTAVELPPELLAKMERLRRRRHLKLRLLQPISWLARAWRQGRELLAERSDSPRPEPPLRPTFDTEMLADGRRRLVNARHRCAIVLEKGMESITVSSKPSAVFAFLLGEIQVSCTARRLRWTDEVLRRPSRSTVLRDDKLRIGDLRARRLRFKLAPSPGRSTPSYLHLDVLQTPNALYVFLARLSAPAPAAVEESIRRVIESFRRIDGDADQGNGELSTSRVSSGSAGGLKMSK